MNSIKQWSPLAIIIIFIAACYGLILNSTKNVFVEYPMEVSKTHEIMTFPTSKCVDSTGNEISTDLDQIIDQVGKKKSCFQAVKMAQYCGWGSSADVSIVSSAAEVCTKELEKNNPSKELNSLLKSMQNMCLQKYEKRDGTIYISMGAYCDLSALEWVTGLSASALD